MTIPENEPDLPFYIWAGSALDRSVGVRLAVNKPWLEKMDADGLSASLGQYCGHIHGYVSEPIEGKIVAKKVSRGLSAAHALYRGLNRNLNDHDQDQQRHAYLVNPTRDFGFQKRAGYMLPRELPKPIDSVFCVYVEFGLSAVARAGEWFGKYLPTNIAGVIHRWEWLTPLSPDDPNLPDNHNTRYLKKEW